jgi:hypothetical protein
VPFTKKVSSWRIKTGQSKDIQRFSYVGSKAPFPYKSPLGQVMQLEHINVREDLFSKKQFDTISNMLLTNHNIWVYLDAFDRANDAVFKDSQQSNVPQKYLDALDVIDEAFVTPNWQALLTKHKDVLDAVSPSQY